MKKLLTISFALFALNAANAQTLTSKKGEAYLPEKGDWAIGFNANNLFRYVGNAFNGNTNNAAPSLTNWVSNSIVGKKFTTANTAYRVVANIGFGTETETDEQSSNTNKYTESGFDVSLGLGKEWRRGKTRLQGYYGADVLLNVNSRSDKETNTSNLTSFKERKDKDGLGFGIGVNGFLGAEYFIFPKISIGAQYQYGLTVSMQGAGEVTTTPWTGAATTSKGSRTSSIGLGNVGVASMNLTLHF
jgi:hypothetical protein